MLLCYEFCNMVAFLQFAMPFQASESELRRCGLERGDFRFILLKRYCVCLAGHRASQQRINSGLITWPLRFQPTENIDIYAKVTGSLIGR